MRWPGVLPAGRKSNQVVSVMDWFPTLAAGLGISPKNERPFDGRNVWDQIRGAKEDVAPEGMVMARSQTEGAVWDGPWKLVVGPRDEIMLFRIDEDPNEERDLSANHPDVLSRLTPRLDEMTQTLPKTVRQQQNQNPAGGQQDSSQAGS